MTDRPIIFSSPMVRALRGSLKTQTRRLSTSPLRAVSVGDRLWVREGFRVAPDACEGWDPTLPRPKGWLDYLAGGDAEVSAPSMNDVIFAISRKRVIDWDVLPDTWKPSIHMPRWASRLTLEVTGTRTERLQSITDSDAIAEGLVWDPVLCAWNATGGENWPRRSNPIDSYAGLWNSLHTDEGERWRDNPEVLVLTFSVIAGNIDRIGMAA